MQFGVHTWYWQTPIPWDGPVKTVNSNNDIDNDNNEDEFEENVVEGRRWWRRGWLEQATA